MAAEPLPESNSLKEHKRISTLLAQGKRDEALREYESFIQNAPDTYDILVNYAMFLIQGGQYAKAAEAARQSIARGPSTEGYHNLGSALRLSENYEEAIEAFKKAIHHNPGFFLSHNDIGTCYEEMRNYEYAIDHYQVAAALAPGERSCWLNLSSARMKEGRIREAVSALRQARKIVGDDSHDLWQRYARCFEKGQDFDVNAQLVDEVTHCLTSPQVDPGKLTLLCQKLFLHQTVVKALIEDLDGYELRNFETLLADETLNWGVFNHTLFVAMLNNIRIHLGPVEKLFTALRAGCLKLVAEGTARDKMWDRPLIFLAAFANLNFYNEYVFWETPEEQESLSTLEESISAAFAGKSVPDPYDVALLGCYRPLFKTPFADELEFAFRDDPVMKDLIRVQITEPLEEHEIKQTLKTMTSIDDEVSKLVRQQYEENPYPRWTRPACPPTRSLRELLQFLFPYLEDDEFEGVNTQNPRILIAGCGSGKHSLEAAMSYANADILSVDISSASLAYAVRKTRQRGFDNIEYGIADILNLGDLGEKFDVILCTGVLHHMDDPMAGWRILNGLLKPGGFMHVGLYSDIARRSVVRAREFIAEKGFKPVDTDIRECRAAIQNLPLDHPVKGIMQWGDFYTTSACRDLIFHVQEHRFTALRLKEAADSLGLRFLGFQQPDNMRTGPLYAEKFPDDPHGLDLEKWHVFEQEHPHSFRSMYQAWFQKPLDQQ
jgi:tetratricopeptide (TPR) repeat protein/2-polyprenyl-3-methyl-5-hydroxy-6-metoxy-1,4-benzoquinol methylase